MARKLMRWTGKALLWLVVALLVLAASGAIYQAVATERAERAYPPPGEMVDVGGFSLHIDCVGRGRPALGPSTQQVSTTALELSAAPHTAAQARNLGSLGDKPLAVVSAGTQGPGWLDLQDDLATLSSDSTHRVVEGATHTSVLDDRSDAWATSADIVEVVAAVRNDRSLAH